MGFRDEREASAQRIEVLERELASLRDELEAAALRAAEVDDLRKRVVLLTAERDTLKRGVEPAWAARNRMLVAVTATIVLMGLCAAAFTYTTHRRSAEVQAAEAARAASELSQCEASLAPVQQQRDAARAELDQIDEAHTEDLRRVQRQLDTARLHEVGSALLVTAAITSREGAVPEGVEDHCAMVIRADHDRTCIATVHCGPTRVFPFNEPAPDVECAQADGARWDAATGTTLGNAVASVRSTPQPLLAYAAGARTLVVRETGTPQFTLHMRVTDVLPFELR